MRSGAMPELASAREILQETCYSERSLVHSFLSRGWSGYLDRVILCSSLRELVGEPVAASEGHVSWVPFLGGSVADGVSQGAQPGR